MIVLNNLYYSQHWNRNSSKDYCCLSPSNNYTSETLIMISKASVRNCSQCIGGWSVSLALHSIWLWRSVVRNIVPNEVGPLFSWYWFWYFSFTDLWKENLTLWLNRFVDHNSLRWGWDWSVCIRTKALRDVGNNSFSFSSCNYFSSSAWALGNLKILSC